MDQLQILTAADDLLSVAGFQKYTELLQAHSNLKQVTQKLVEAVELMDGALVSMTGHPRSKPREDVIWAKNLLQQS